MNIKVLRPRCYLVKKLIKNYSGNSSIFSPTIGWWFDWINHKFVSAAFKFSICDNFFVIFLQNMIVFLSDFSYSSLVNDTFFDKFLRIKLKNCRLVFDFVIHDWLSEIRLILFVMAESPISDNINKNVFVKFLPVLDGDLHAFV